MGWLENMFYICFAVGIIYGLITILIGDFFHFHIPLFEPYVLISLVTAYGGLGTVLLYSTHLSSITIIIISACISIIISILCYFFWVKPIKNAETSTGFSLSDLEGSIAEVYTTIPSKGFGEIEVVRINGRSYYTAASYEKVEIPRGSKVLVIENVNGILYVNPYKPLFEKK